MSEELEFLLKALIKHNFDKIVIEPKGDWIAIRFTNKEDRQFYFKFPTKQIEDFK